MKRFFSGLLAFGLCVSPIADAQEAKSGSLETKLQKSTDEANRSP